MKLFFISDALFPPSSYQKSYLFQLIENSWNSRGRSGKLRHQGYSMSSQRHGIRRQWFIQIETLLAGIRGDAKTDSRNALTAAQCPPDRRLATPCHDSLSLQPLKIIRTHLFSTVMLQTKLRPKNELLKCWALGIVLSKKWILENVKFRSAERGYDFGSPV